MKYFFQAHKYCIGKNATPAENILRVPRQQNETIECITSEFGKVSICQQKCNLETWHDQWDNLHSNRYHY